LAGAGAAIGLGGLRRPTCSADQGELRLARKAGRAFGTTASIDAWHLDERAARDAVEAAFRELLLVEELMSIYRPDSQLSRLNRKGVLDRPHPYFLRVLQEAESMSRRSQGAFDITVQPLWSVYAEAQEAGRLPSAAAIERARQAIDWSRVVTEPERIRLLGKGTQITLNGIAQGFAADRAAEALVACGVVHALVDAGELGAIGNKPRGKPWSVAIQHPRQEDAYLALAKLNGRCLATSGDYATTFTSDFMSNHLFDPHSGRSPTDFASVSIAAPTAVLADALSTAVFVLGVSRGLELVQSTPGADALVMLKSGRTLTTRGFPLERHG
jgi:thiamine biosynthesis lipoprotein